MLIKLIQNVPQHGLVWFSVSDHCGLYGAKTKDGEHLVSQFLPFDMDNPQGTGGFLLVRIPENVDEIELTAENGNMGVTTDPFVFKCEQGLIVVTSGGCFSISDSLSSVEPYQCGTYRMFDKDIQTTVLNGPLFDVCRVKAIPSDEEGCTIGNTVAVYDFIRMKDIPMVQIFASFKGEACWSVNNVSFAQLVVPKDVYTSWSAGEPACGGTFDPNPETGTVPILESTIPVIPVEGVHGYETDFEHYFGLKGEKEAIALVGGHVTAYFYPHVVYGDKYWQVGFKTMEGRQNLMDFDILHPLMGTVIIGDAAQNAHTWCKQLPPVIRVNTGSRTVTDLIAGDLAVQLNVSENHISLCGITDKKTGTKWLENGDEILFRALIRDISAQKNIWVTSAGDWENIKYEKSESGAIIQFNDSKQAPGFSARFQVKMDAEHSGLEWQGSFENKAASFSVLACDYPRMHFDAPEKANIFTPYLSGHVHHEYGRCHAYWNGEYANLWCTLPMLSCWDDDTGRGLYMAAHDPHGCTKKICMDKHMGEVTSFSISYIAENALIPLNSQTMGGKVVWRLYDGDWYDATQIYRGWVLQEADWLPPMDAEHKRTDSPDWIHDIGIWCMGGGTEREGWEQPILDLQKEMGVPVAVHLYYWHKIPFDTCYPHYFPVKDYTVSGIQKLHEANIRVIPYINGRLWDVNDKEDVMDYTGEAPDFTFEQDGEVIATTEEDGSIIREAYCSYRKNGERVRLNGICLSQTKWHDIIERLGERIYDELGVDGIYVDQTAGSSCATSYNPNHGHPLGTGGTWHITGTRQMMKRLQDLRQKKGLQSIYITEDHSEQFICSMDGMLVWHWSSGGLVPAFPAVYSDQVELFGRNFPLAAHLSEEDRKYARITFAEQMTFGDQLGWNVSFLTNSGRLDADMQMYKQAIQLRYHYREYYTHGTLCRPPKVVCEAPDIVVHRTNDYHTNCLYGHAISAGLRAHASNGSRLLTVINITAQEQQCELICELPDGEMTLEGAINRKVLIHNGRIMLCMPPRSTVMGVVK